MLPSVLPSVVRDLVVATKDYLDGTALVRAALAAVERYTHGMTRIPGPLALPGQKWKNKHTSALATVRVVELLNLTSGYIVTLSMVDSEFQLQQRSLLEHFELVEDVDAEAL